MEPASDANQANPPRPANPPVMDIKAPAKAPVAEPVKTPPPETEPANLAEDADPKKKPEKPPKPPKPLKQPGSGVGLAVFATIIIVLGLGALFVYAYLRTQGINPY